MSYGKEFLADHAYEIEHGLPIKELTIPSIDKKGDKKMAQKVLILGDSGTGKSASLRNFKPEELLVINAAGKPLPFKNHFECVTPSFDKLTQDVLKAMDKTNKKVIVIDDAQYIMSFQYMRRLKEKGWDKWDDIQGDFFNIIQACDYMPDDVVVYFLSHLSRDEEGREKIKTMGKMLDEKITIEGLFTTVLKTAVKDGQYFFLTQNSGMDTVKSPIGMFPSYAIDNDLKYVDIKIRNYYEIGDYADDQTVEKMDEEVKAEDIQKPDADGKRRRKRTKDEPVQPVSTDERNDGRRSNTASDDAEEKAAEQPKTRRRKDRTAKVNETPAEVEKQQEQPEKPVLTDDEINKMMDEGDFKSLADATPAESVTADEPTTEVHHKRRRRSRPTEGLDITSTEETY